MGVLNGSIAAYRLEDAGLPYTLFVSRRLSRSSGSLEPSAAVHGWEQVRLRIEQEILPADPGPDHSVKSSAELPADPPGTQ